MATTNRIYTGPQLALWRRFSLRYARMLTLLFALAWITLIVLGIANRVPPLPRALSVVFAGFALSLVMAVWAGRERERLVREAPLPQFLKRKLREAYPHLSGKDCDLVERGLRQFFLACLRSRRKFVAMPSKVVDSMWHEFILHTRAYRDWCDVVLGRFMDHVPAEALGRRPACNDGLRRAWYWACRDEAIAPRKPSRLPLLFALDSKLAIAGGFIYTADCSALASRVAEGAAASSAVYCGESFSDGTYSADAGGFGGEGAADGASGSCDGDSGGGGGDGGDGGDGGGCGGGD